MDGVYFQSIPIFEILPVDLLAHLLVVLNGGAIGNNYNYKSGFLHPGYHGGRELHYYEISHDAMKFWKFVCKHLRHTYSLQRAFFFALLEKNTPQIETWTPDWQDMCYMDYEDQDRERDIPRHFYAGNAEKWISLMCCGPQTHLEACIEEAAEAVKESKVAIKEARKEQRRLQATMDLAKWGVGKRILRVHPKDKRKSPGQNSSLASRGSQ